MALINSEARLAGFTICSKNIAFCFSFWILCAQMPSVRIFGDVAYEGGHFSPGRGVLQGGHDDDDALEVDFLGPIVKSWIWWGNTLFRYRTEIATPEQNTEKWEKMQKQKSKKCTKCKRLRWYRHNGLFERLTDLFEKINIPQNQKCVWFLLAAQVDDEKLLYYYDEERRLEQEMGQRTLKIQMLEVTPSYRPTTTDRDTVSCVCSRRW